MTKEELEFSIHQYIEKEANITSDATLKKKASTLNSFLKKYNEEKTLHDNIANFLKDNSFVPKIPVGLKIIIPTSAKP